MPITDALNQARETLLSHGFEALNKFSKMCSDLELYNFDPSIPRLHQATLSAVDVVRWKIKYECFEKAGSVDRFEFGDVLNSIYLYAYNLILRGDYDSPKHLANKLAFKIRYCRANELIHWHESVNLPVIEDRLAAILDIAKSQQAYSNDLLDKAWEFLSGSDGEFWEQYIIYWNSWHELEKRSGKPREQIKAMVADARKSLRVSDWKPALRNLADISEEVRILRRKNLSLREIARKLGVSYKKVQTTAKKIA